MGVFRLKVHTSSALRLSATPITSGLEDIALTPFVITASGGDGDYTFSIEDNPAGTSLTGSGATRTFSGTVAEPGDFTITVRVEDGAGQVRYLIWDLSISVPSSPPFPSAQTVKWGAKTLIGFGAHDLGYVGEDALSITSQTNGGGAVSLWTIDTDNRLTVTGPALSWGAAAPTYAGPYTVVVTDGTFSSTVTIDIEENRFDARPRATDTSASNEVVRIYKQTNCNTHFGDAIKLRAGVYATTKWTLSKTAAFTQDVGGPLAPSAVDSSLVSWSTENDDGWVTISPDGDAEVTIRNMEVSGTSVPHYISFEGGILFERFNTTSSSSVSAVPIQAEGSWFRIKECRFRSRVEGDTPSSTNMCSAFRTIGTHVSYLFLEDNDVADVYVGFSVSGDHTHIIGNDIHDQYNDSLKGGLTHYKIMWNTFRNHKNYVTENPADAPHPDYIQQSGGSRPAGTYVGGWIIGNLLYRGETGGDVTDGQCIFISTMPAGVYWSDMVVRGNFCMGSKVNAIRLSQCIDPIVEWNTGVSPRIADPGSRLINVSDGTGGVARFNAFESIATGQVTVSQNVATSQVQATLNAQFVNPNRTTDVGDPAQILADWAMKPGGTLDMSVTGFAANCGAIGTGYVDFDARTTNFPAV